MNKKIWLIILILFAIFTTSFFWYFKYFTIEVSLPNNSEQRNKTEEKNAQTIELEKPPFIK